MSATATLVTHGVISSHSSTAGDGTGHGADTMQIVILPDGTQYATTLDDTAKPWPDINAPFDEWRNTHVFRSTDGGATWTEISAFAGGHESGYLCLQQGQLVLICYPDGRPSVWKLATNAVEPIPGAWQTRIGSNANEVDGWWYGGAGVAPDGTIFLARAKVNPTNPYNKPVTYQCQTINPDGSYGTFFETNSLADGRFGYGFLFPAGDGTWRMAGMLAIEGSEAGYPAEAYVWLDPAVLRFDPVAHTVTVVTYLYHGTVQANGNAPHITVGDAIQLPGGDLLITYSGVDGLHPGWFSSVTRVSPAGTVRWTNAIPFSYGNVVRLAPLSDGSVLLANLFPDHPNGPGTPALAYATLDPSAGTVSLPSYLPITDALDWSANTQNEFAPCARGGSALPADTLILKFSMGPGATEDYYRFHIAGLGTPPAPTPTDLSVLQSAVLTLQQAVLALQADDTRTAIAIAAIRDQLAAVRLALS